MAQEFSNNGSTVLEEELNGVGTFIRMADTSIFPNLAGNVDAGKYFLLTLQLSNGVYEIVRCIKTQPGGLDVVRAQENTTAKVFPTGTRIELRVTAATLNQSLRLSDEGVLLLPTAMVNTVAVTELNVGSAPITNVPWSDVKNSDHVHRAANVELLKEQIEAPQLSAERLDRMSVEIVRSTPHPTERDIWQLDYAKAVPTVGSPPAPRLGERILFQAHEDYIISDGSSAKWLNVKVNNQAAVLVARNDTNSPFTVILPGDIKKDRVYELIYSPTFKFDTVPAVPSSPVWLLMNPTQLEPLESAALIDQLFPIGTIKLTVGDKNPSTTDNAFKHQTWVRIAEGRFLAGVGEGTDADGNKVTLTVGTGKGQYHYRLDPIQMPEHDHFTAVNPLVFGQAGGQLDAGHMMASNSYPGDYALRNANNSDDPDRFVGKTSPSGHQAPWPVSNIPPWFGIYIWERTA